MCTVSHSTVLAKHLEKDSIQEQEGDIIKNYTVYVAFYLFIVSIVGIKR